MGSFTFKHLLKMSHLKRYFYQCTHLLLISLQENVGEHFISGGRQEIFRLIESPGANICCSTSVAPRIRDTRPNTLPLNNSCTFIFYACPQCMELLNLYITSVLDKTK